MFSVAEMEERGSFKESMTRETSTVDYAVVYSVTAVYSGYKVSTCRGVSTSREGPTSCEVSGSREVSTSPTSREVSTSREVVPMSREVAPMNREVRWSRLRVSRPELFPARRYESSPAPAPRFPGGGRLGLRSSCAAFLCGRKQT